LSMFLVQNNQKVLKLLPCGTISDVLPWLARRMQENNDSFSRTSVEKNLIQDELKIRLSSIITIRRA